MTRKSSAAGMLVAVMAAGQFAPASVSAQDDDVESFDRTPVECVQLNRVRNTEVLDDRTILFHLRDGTILRNHLPRTCPDLEREDRFSYQARTRRLCNIDTITVLPLGFGIGATCPLGPFYPMTPEELEDLRQGPSNVEVSPVESSEEEGLEEPSEEE